MGSHKATVRVQGLGAFVEHRGLLRNRDNTRSSPHLSVVALGCLNGGDERGRGQGCYLSQLGQRPDMDTMSRVELLRETMPQLARMLGSH